MNRTIFDDFKKRLNTNKSDTVAYGRDDIQLAVDHGAVKFLLTTEQKTDSIITNVMAQGGQVVRYTQTKHGPAHGFITDMGGYCAVLRFSLPEQSEDTEYQSSEESVEEEEKAEDPVVPQHEVVKHRVSMTQLLVNAPRSGRTNPFADASKANPFAT